jgi:hypothetical protein
MSPSSRREDRTEVNAASFSAKKTDLFNEIILFFNQFRSAFDAVRVACGVESRYL